MRINRSGSNYCIFQLVVAFIVDVLKKSACIMQFRQSIPYQLLQIVYVARSGQTLHVHDHPSDQTCHWVTVLKPLALIVFCDQVLVRSLMKSSYSKGKLINRFDDLQYA